MKRNSKKNNLNDTAETLNTETSADASADAKEENGRKKLNLGNIKSNIKLPVGVPGFVKKHKKAVIICAVIIIGGGTAIIKIKIDRENEAAALALASVNTAQVMRGDVISELTSSGTLEPKDTYTITSQVSGEIIQADFEEGDQVEKGDVLYVIDQSDMSTSVDQAERTLNSATQEYEQAVIAYNEAISNLGGGTIRATQSGYVRDITINSGDTLSQGNITIASLYDDSAMTLRLGFLSTDADALAVGQDIVVEIGDTGETIPGVVNEKSDLIESINGGTLIKYVTVLVSNPGGLTESDRATAYTGDIVSVTDALFEAYESGSLTVELPSSVKVSQVLVSEGQYVSSGTALFTITSESLRDALNSAENSLTSAENTLKNAENNVESVNETVDRYTITAPISGQVITKNGKVGDNVNQGSDTTELALIYDLSELTFEMSIDELDISSVEVGQEVDVTADAVDGVIFTGHVTNVGLNSTYSSGVTTYPVVVTLDDSEGLLPGMNVDGEIILAESYDTLYIPSGALLRGNIVYVRDESLNDENVLQADQEDAASISDAPSGFTAVIVETGVTSDDYVEIISGLSEGQEVYVRDTATSTTTQMGMGGGMPGGGGGGMPGGGGGGGGPR